MPDETKEGMPAQPRTPATDADPQRPDVQSQPETAEQAKARAAAEAAAAAREKARAEQLQKIRAQIGTRHHGGDQPMIGRVFAVVDRATRKVSNHQVAIPGEWTPPATHEAVDITDQMPDEFPLIGDTIG